MEMLNALASTRSDVNGDGKTEMNCYDMRRVVRCVQRTLPKEKWVENKWKAMSIHRIDGLIASFIRWQGFDSKLQNTSQIVMTINCAPFNHFNTSMRVGGVALALLLRVSSFHLQHSYRGGAMLLFLTVGLAPLNVVIEKNVFGLSTLVFSFHE